VETAPGSSRPRSSRIPVGTPLPELPATRRSRAPRPPPRPGGLGPDEPPAVGGGHQGPKPESAAVGEPQGPDGKLASRLQGMEDRALRGHRAPGGGMVEGPDPAAWVLRSSVRTTTARAPCPGAGSQAPEVEGLADPGPPAHPADPGGGQEDGIVAALVHVPDPGVQVPPDGRISRSGRKARARAVRRRELVPDTRPLRKESAEGRGHTLRAR
jgi:hypothetical protein